MRMSCYRKLQGRVESPDGRQRRNPHEFPPAVRWQGANRSQWQELVEEARDRAAAGLTWMNESNEQDPDRANCIIFANEQRHRSAALARSNIQYAGFQDHISLREGDCLDWDLDDYATEIGGEAESRALLHGGRTMVVANPPWGKRLTEEVEESWSSLGEFVRRECDGSHIWVLSSSAMNTSQFIRLKRKKHVSLKTADEMLRWSGYWVLKKSGYLRWIQRSVIEKQSAEDEALSWLREGISEDQTVE
eukprot:gnl/TRDRNA2_/TRDRNA2_29415_c0_seq2.p1 gnl/TRDRNA2_/TRDRNA2_29415_c0~~gnl/TRDRNA2_/TRDRNA2_29415_c0_seq2.p1  ORF type:complete len:248 (+),score=23.23 gnl/TRDRNA2_/TRDRNA2_29415_c0_seq2:53-796(+)